MTAYLGGIAKTLLLPPGCLILLGFFGLWVRARRPRLGWGCVALAIVLLYGASAPLVGRSALGLLQPPYVDPVSRPEGRAIVVLGGGTYRGAPEYGGDTVNTLTLVRLRYAAKLARATGKPLLVAGGSPSGDTPPEAERMRTVLTQEFGLEVAWAEDRSRDTLGNALESFRILAPLGITTVYVVTHAWHMPRARYAFEHAGFTVIPAPTAYSELNEVGLSELIPSTAGLADTTWFCYEVLGHAWYKLRVGYGSLRGEGA